MRKKNKKIKKKPEKKKTRKKTQEKKKGATMNERVVIQRAAKSGGKVGRGVERSRGEKGRGGRLAPEKEKEALGSKPLDQQRLKSNILYQKNNNGPLVQKHFLWTRKVGDTRNNTIRE